MRRLSVRFAGISFAAAFLVAGVLSSGARAQESTAAPEPTSAPTAAPTPVATPNPTSAPESPAPTDSPAPTTAPTPAAQAQAGAPQITPWPWPFPWMQQELDRRAAEEAAKGASAAPGVTSAVSGPRVPTASTRSPAGRVDKGLRASRAIGSDAPIGADTDAAGRNSQGTPGLPDVPTGQQGPSAVIAPSPSAPQQCEYKVIQHGIASDTAAIMQMAVQNEDCTTGGSQVLISYEIRGPPSIDVLLQSSKVYVDVEAFVEKERMRLKVKMAGSNGVIVPLASPVPSTGSGPALTPLATGFDSVNQNGDNQIGVSQESIASSGDALSGSQRFRLHVDGDAGDVRINAQNSAPGAFANSDDASADNSVTGNAGGSASGDSGAQAGQIGDNDVNIDQDARARSGDALAGSQQIEVDVNGSVRDLAVLAQNASSGAVATSGDAFAGNDATGVAGPGATSQDGPALAGQIGDNHVDIGQSAAASTGDAIAGSQVIDIVVTGSVGDLAVLADNNSDGAQARSGDALAVNSAAAVAGPVAGSTDGDAMSSQFGDNFVTVGQAAQATSGRAIAGSQVISVTVGGVIANAAIQPINASQGASAVSGSATADNLAGGSLGPIATAGSIGQAQQAGNNELTVDQWVLPSTGDAVSGSTVVGLVEPSRTTYVAEPIFAVV